MSDFEKAPRNVFSHYRPPPKFRRAIYFLIMIHYKYIEVSVLLDAMILLMTSCILLEVSS